MDKWSTGLVDPYVNMLQFQIQMNKYLRSIYYNLKAFIF